jgi:multicomponent K+:H+ antiporter subunit G
MNGQELPLWVALPAALLMVTGGLLALIGALGLVRMPDIFSRAHPPTMGTTLGTGCILMTSMLVSSALLHRPVFHEVLIGLFLLLTAPITAMLLMRAAVARRKQRDTSG